MLQTLREYGLDKLDRATVAPELHRSHANWLVDLTETEMPDGDAATTRTRIVLTPELENFRSTLEWAEEAGQTEVMARLVGDAKPPVGFV